MQDTLCVSIKITSRSSKFLTACTQFNAGEISRHDLIAITVRQGFNNVIDAFHNVNQGEIEKRFFVDERWLNGVLGKNVGIFRSISIASASQLKSFTTLNVPNRLPQVIMHKINMAPV